MQKTLFKLLRKKLNNLEPFVQDLQVVELTHQALDLLLASDTLMQRQEVIVEALWTENRRLYNDLQELAKEIRRIQKALDNSTTVPEIKISLSPQTKVAVHNALDKDYHEAYGESIRGKVPQ